MPPVRRRLVDRLRELLETELYWTLQREDDGSWTLRQFYGETGVISDPLITLSRVDADDDLGAQITATNWAADNTGITDWSNRMDAATGRVYEAGFELIRDIRSTPRRGRRWVLRVPEEFPRGLVDVHERYETTGNLSPVVFRIGFDDCKTIDDLLRKASERFGVALWVPTDEGVYVEAPVTGL